jgi:periplasmic copper chaperone A
MNDRWRRSRAAQRYISAFLVCALAALPAFGAAEKSLTVSNSWFRFIMASRPAAGYFILTNASSKPHVLTGVSSPACGSLMMHKSQQQNGEDTMAMVSSIPVPAQGAVTFAPGGYHLMCMSPTKDMKVGAKVPVTLSFDNGSTLTQDFVVHNVSGE